VNPEAQNLVDVRTVRQGQKETVEALIAAGTAYWLKASIDLVTKEIWFENPFRMGVLRSALVPGSWE